MQTSPITKIGAIDPLRTQRLLDIAGLLKRNGGGQVSLRWPDQNSALRAERSIDEWATGREPLFLGNQLRAHSAIVRAGASTLTLPLIQESAMPSIDRSKKATWGNSADVAPTLNLTDSTPRRLSAYVNASKQLVDSHPMIAAAFIEAQLLSAIGAALDDSAINGSGTAEPFGLLADPGLLEHEYAGSDPVVSDLLAMEAALADAHGERDPFALGWLVDSATRKRLRGVPRMTAGTTPAWPDQAGQGALGYRGTVSPFAPAKTVIYGDFSDLLVVQSHEITVLMNPYSLDTQGFIRLTIAGYFDVLALNPGQSLIRAVAAP